MNEQIESNENGEVQTTGTLVSEPAPVVAKVRMYQSGRAIDVDAADVEHFETLGFRQESDEQHICPRCGAEMGYLDGRDGPGDRWELGDGTVVCGKCYSGASTPGPGHPVYEKAVAQAAETGTTHRFENG